MKFTKFQHYNQRSISALSCILAAWIGLNPLSSLAGECSEPYSRQVWSEPSYTGSEKAQILQSYQHLDPEQLVPRQPKEKAILMFHKYQQRISNKNYLTVFDVSQHASNRRLYIIDLNSGKVDTELASHGSGSDPNSDGWANRFSDQGQSNMTSVGFYLMNEIDEGSKHDFSLKMDGLSPSNQNARRRCIVMHPADYVQMSNLSGGRGRSQGCPALEGQTGSQLSKARRIVEELKGGSLMYIHYNAQQQALYQSGQSGDLASEGSGD